jgi:hypothetical protein
MIDGNNLISLLGKSERDEQIKKMLVDFGIKTPLPRPKKNDNEVYIEPKNKGVDFIFKDAKSIFSEPGNFAEGELIFDTVFFYPSGCGKNKRQISLPFDLEVKSSRIHAGKRFGKPHWSNPDESMKSDKWIVGKTSVHLEFDDNEESIELITVSFIS